MAETIWTSLEYLEPVVTYHGTTAWDGRYLGRWLLSRIGPFQPELNLKGAPEFRVRYVLQSPKFVKAFLRKRGR